jgi:hypothetical protein
MIYFRCRSPRGFIAYLLRTVTVLVLLAESCAPVSGDPPPAGQDQGLTTGPLSQRIPFEEASQELSAVFPIRLLEYSQVVQHSYNWRGREDASLMCDIGFTPRAIVIKGEYRDDTPFYQPMERPAMPDWWKIRYGADGIQFIMDNPTSAAQRLDIALNFGSAATKSRVEVLQSPQNRFRGFLVSADFAVEQGKVPSSSESKAAGSGAQKPPILFHAAIPIDGLAEAALFSGRLRITARLHDMDGDAATYLMMQEVIEKK